MFLIVGGDSEIGTALCLHLQARGHAAASTTRRCRETGQRRLFLDLSTPLADWEPPESTRAVCITAGIARIAACAADPPASAAVNVAGTLALAERLIERGIYVLFLSSNQVFDGTVPHVAVDAPVCPVSEYGRQKARTENALRTHLERGAPIAILRLAKVISPTMPLISSWVQALAAGRRIHAFHDMRMAPTPISIVVDTITALMREGEPGIFQLSGPRDASYADIARSIAVRIGADPTLIEPVGAAAAAMPVGAAPLNTTLDSARICNAYGLVVPETWETLEPFVGADAHR